MAPRSVPIPDRSSERRLHDQPAPGDLIIRKDAGYWVMAVNPDPAQVRYPTLMAAVTAALRFARTHPAAIWQTVDGKSFVRIELEAPERTS